MIFYRILNMFLIKLLLLVLSVIDGQANQPPAPPVLIWGTNLPQASSVFETVSTDKFMELLRPLRKNHMIIVYLVPSLSSLDLTCPGQLHCFYNMRQVKPRSYYSQVHRPLRALQMLLKPSEHRFLWKKQDAMIQLPCKINTIHAYNFTDRNLTEHDSFMGSVSWSLTFCPLIQIYTAHDEESSALERRRHRLEMTQSKSLDNDGDAFKSHAPGYWEILYNKNAVLVLEKIVMAEETREGPNVRYKRQTLKVKNDTLTVAYLDPNDFQNGIKLMFETSCGPLSITVLPIRDSWRISQMSLNGTITFKPRDLVVYSQKYSLCCRVLTSYSASGNRLSIYMFHLDFVFDDQVTAMDPEYIPRACWTCESYLTPAIATALFTIFILLVLLYTGMSHLLGIERQLRVANAGEPEIMVKGFAEQ